jgi:hypothetical protein
MDFAALLPSRREIFSSGLRLCHLAFAKTMRPYPTRFFGARIFTSGFSLVCHRRGARWPSRRAPDFTGATSGTEIPPPWVTMARRPALAAVHDHKRLGGYQGNRGGSPPEGVGRAQHRLAGVVVSEFWLP